MRRQHIILIGLLTVALMAPQFAHAKSSLGFSVGTGVPLGWWGERWGMFQASEINLRYEFAPETGFMLLAGLDKTYFSKMSAEEVKKESRFRDGDPIYLPYTKITTANQDGSFKQLPVGFGFYRELEISGYQTYASLAMVVHLWRFERGQQFAEVVTPPTDDTLRHTDNWWTEQDGSNVGFQLGAGFLYPLDDAKKYTLDVSVVYHLVSLSANYAAVAYHGQPARARDWRPEERDKVKNSVNFILLRAGIRLGY